MVIVVKPRRQMSSGTARPQEAHRLRPPSASTSASPQPRSRELRRSIFDRSPRSDLNATIILNAKTLIEKDADFAKFAGRIQLTYIYEEVLGWDIVRDGIGKP
jgi:hypothetical protein